MTTVPESDEVESDKAVPDRAVPESTTTGPVSVFADARHAEAHDRDGRRIGALEQVFLSAEDGRPLWVEVAGGLFGMDRTVIPAEGARRSGDVIILDVTVELVHRAPTIDPLDGITAAEHSRLATHYGRRDVSLPGSSSAPDAEAQGGLSP